MALSTAIQPSSAGSTAPVRGFAIAAVAVTAIAALTLAGITFIGLAIAFPIAVPAATALHVPVSPVDVEIAKRVSEFSWIFGVLAFVSLSAAALIAFKAIETLSPAPRD